MAAASVPPGSRIEIMVGSRDDADLYRSGEYASKNITGAAGVMVRSDEKHALPTPVDHKATESECFLVSALCGVRKTNQSIGGDAALGEISVGEVGLASVRAERRAAGHNARCPAAAVELGGTSGAISLGIITTKDDEDVGGLEGVFGDEAFACKLEDGAANEVENKKQGEKKNQHEETEKNGAALGGPHVGSVWRSFSAACSGSKPLK